MTENTNHHGWVLPDDVASMLRDAYAAYRGKVSEQAFGGAKEEALKSLATIAQAGRVKGWPYAEMAATCEMTAERMRQIVATLDDEDRNSETVQELATEFPQYTPPPNRGRKRPRKVRRKPRRSILTKDELEKLGALAPIARRTSGSTPVDSPIRDATVELSKLIIRLHDRGVVWKDLADATGLTTGAVRARAARHGYHQGPPPSIPRYRGTTIYDDPKRKRSSAKATKRETEQDAKDEKKTA